jgi:beta-galactosidase
MRSGTITYCGGWGDDAYFDRLVNNLCAQAEVDITNLPKGVRLRDTQTERFWFNHNPHSIEIDGKIMEPAGVVRQTKG